MGTWRQCGWMQSALLVCWGQFWTGMKGVLFLLLYVYTALENGPLDLRVMHNWNILKNSLKKALIWEGRVLQFPVNVLSLNTTLFNISLFPFCIKYKVEVNLVLLPVRAKDCRLGVLEDTSISAMGNSGHPPVAGVNVFNCC